MREEEVWSLEGLGNRWWSRETLQRLPRSFKGKFYFVTDRPLEQNGLGVKQHAVVPRCPAISTGLTPHPTVFIIEWDQMIEGHNV